MNNVLVNPVWEALSSKQSQLNRGSQTLKYFPQEVSPFMGLKNWDAEDLVDLEKNIPTNRTFSVMIAKAVTIPPSFEIIFSIPLYQMVCTKLIPSSNPSIAIKKLGNKDIPKMIALTELTKPGPFYERTIDFGHYFGIFDEEELIAMAGERLQVNGFTEISAICTNPEYLGKGYGSLLLSNACERTMQERNTPFLHVRTDNTRAIHVYQKLGFTINADVYFAIFKKRIM